MKSPHVHNHADALVILRREASRSEANARAVEHIDRADHLANLKRARRLRYSASILDALNGKVVL